MLLKCVNKVYVYSNFSNEVKYFGDWIKECF